MPYNRILKIIILWAILVYFAGAFVLNEMDAMLWSACDRVVYLVAALLFAWVNYCVESDSPTAEIEQENEKLKDKRLSELIGEVNLLWQNQRVARSASGFLTHRPDLTQYKTVQEKIECLEFCVKEFKK